MSSQSSDDGQERKRKKPRLSAPSNEKEEEKESVSIKPDTYDEFLEIFECPICNISICDGPILQCPAGHIICQKCKDKLARLKKCPQCRKKIGDDCRNRALEATREKLPMYCKNKPFGCAHIVEPSERKTHAEECDFIPFRCPKSYFDDAVCPWEGLANHLDDHWLANHSDKIREFKEESATTCFLFAKKVQLADFSNSTELMSMGERRYVMAACFSSGRFHVQILHIGDENPFGKYHVDLDLKDEQTIKFTGRTQSIRDKCQIDNWFSVSKNLLNLKPMDDPTSHYVAVFIGVAS
eukprot:147675_1